MFLQDVIEKDLKLNRQEWVKDPILVRAIQLRLFDAGLLGNEDITGTFDQRSEDALKRFMDLAYFDSKGSWVLEKKLASALHTTTNEWERRPKGDLMKPKRDLPFQLEVPYFPQKGKACVAASNAMLLKFLKPDSIQGFEDYFNQCADPSQHEQTKILEKFGIRSEWRPDLSFEDLNSHLDRGIPIVVSLQHLGSVDAPQGGHTLVVVGRESETEYICHDPLGLGFDTNYQKNLDGKSAVYSKKSFENRWLVRGQPNTGWGRIVF